MFTEALSFDRISLNVLAIWFNILTLKLILIIAISKMYGHFLTIYICCKVYLIKITYQRALYLKVKLLPHFVLKVLPHKSYCKGFQYCGSVLSLQLLKCLLRCK